MCKITYDLRVVQYHIYGIFAVRSASKGNAEIPVSCRESIIKRAGLFQVSLTLLKACLSWMK